MSEDLKKITELANNFSIDAVTVRDRLLELDAKVKITEAHRDRLWKAMGEIEAYIHETDKDLEREYKAKSWVPIADRVASDTAHPVPTYFDGLARITAKLRPIILGAK